MSPRLPPKISLKHEWKRELGSEHAQRPEVGQLSRSSQSNQPTLSPIRERSGRPDFTHDVIGVQDGRKTSRSQEIDVNSFCEEPSSSERTKRPVTRPIPGKPVHETSVIHTRSSEDRKDFNVEQIHERTVRPGITHNVINVSDSSQTRSAHKSETFNVEDEILRKRTERSVADHDVSHESIMVNEADMDFRIPGLPHSVVKHAQSTSVRELIQKIENHPDRRALQQDLRQNQSYNTFSPESKQMIQDVGNIELCELLETEPKTQCTVCLSYWNIGILYCTCGHFLHKKTAVNRKFINCTMDHFSVPEYVIKKGRSHGHRYGKKPGDKEYYLANQLKKKCKKKQFQGIHDRFLQYQEFRNRMIENHREEDLRRRWDALADEDHTHHLRAQEYLQYKNKWWLHSNKQGSNTMPLRHRSDFKQALSTLQRLQQEAGEEPQVLLTLTNTNNGRHAVHVLHGGIGKVHGGLLIIPKVKTEMHQVLSERATCCLQYLARCFVYS